MGNELCNIYEGFPDFGNKLAHQMTYLKCYRVLCSFRTVISTIIGASDQDYPMSTGGGETEAEITQEFFSFRSALDFVLPIFKVS